MKKAEFKIKNPHELQTLVENVKNGGKEAEREIYEYFDLIHNSLMNYQGFINQLIFSIDEHNVNVVRG